MSEEPDIVNEIWRRHALDAEGRLVRLDTAERRLALDDALRAELCGIESEALRAHAAAMIRERRAWALTEAGVGSGAPPLYRRVRALEIGIERIAQRVSELEALVPRPDGWR